MHRAPTCPHGPHPIHPPGPWSSTWTCPDHGAIQPLHPAGRPRREAFTAVARVSRVPLWLPWPLPANWLVTGVTYAGDERTGGHATVVACSGPHIAAGPAELLLVAEEPGIGLGARYAGDAESDPGSSCVGRAHAQVRAEGHDTPLWWVAGAPGRAVYVGEAVGQWLWVVLVPESAGALLLEDVLLVDARSELPADLPFGALSPLLAD